MQLCECGCGQPTRIINGKANRYLPQHCWRRLRPPAPARRPAADRFWAKVDKSKGPDTCWLWTGGTVHSGYGRFMMEPGRVLNAQRAAWELTYGSVAADLVVCHRCDNPPCVNPAHLFLGTTQDNLRDAMAKGRLKLIDGSLFCGEANGHAKLTESDVCTIRARHAAGVSQRQLAREYGLRHYHIAQIVQRKIWRHI